MLRQSAVRSAFPIGLQKQTRGAAYSSVFSSVTTGRLPNTPRCKFSISKKKKKKKDIRIGKSKVNVWTRLNASRFGAIFKLLLFCPCAMAI